MKFRIPRSKNGVAVNPSQAPAADGWNPLTLALLTAVWIAVFSNWPLWNEVLALDETGWGFVAAFCAMVTALTGALLALFAWRWTLKPVLVLFLLAAAAGAHFMGTYGVVIDRTMMVNLMQTDVRETRDLLSPRLFASLVLLAGVPVAWLLRVRVVPARPARQLVRNLVGVAAGIAVLIGAFFAVSADFSAAMRNHQSLRFMINPLNAFYGIGMLLRERAAQPRGPLQPIGLDARLVARGTDVRPPLFVFVVGKTARADHFSLNGYARPTNPELAQLDLVSFTDVTSCGTSTAASLPCMFSHLGRAAYEARERDYEDLLDLLQRAGLAVLRIDNQSGCKGLCDRVPHAHAAQAPPGMAPPPAALCARGECFDEALLYGIDARIAALPAARRAHGVVLFLHPMGSHGPAYSTRSPDDRKVFLPECRTNVLKQCDPAGLVNAFDNSIRYADHVLARTIAWLQSTTARFDPTLLYVSDHGESLGESGLYLHGLPYAFAPRVQTHVPMLFWAAPQTLAHERISMDCLRARRAGPLKHDHLFHTVLPLVGVHASEYRAGLDAFAACRQS